MDGTEKLLENTEEKVSSKGSLIYRALVALGSLLFLVSWFMPWWTIDIEGFGLRMVHIRPWGLIIDERMGDFAILLKGSEMPSFFTPLMWLYFALCVLALVVGFVVCVKAIRLGKLKMTLSQLLIGGVGLSYFIAGIVMAVFASYRMEKMGVPLVGRTFIDLGDPVIAFLDTYLLPGYYLIYVAAFVLILTALFEKKILGKR